MVNFRMIAALFSVLLCALALSGCIETSETIVVDHEGMALVNFSAKAEATSGAESLAQLAWQLEQMMPQLNNEYERQSYIVTEDYTDYLVYEWRAKNKIPVDEIKGASWIADNGSYEFRMNLEKLYDPAHLNESSFEEVVMDIQVTMPEPIEIANTPFVEGETASWTITKEMLLKNNTLRAITK
jgi:hypothetical protein